jgi:hypothetical protein
MRAGILRLAAQGDPQVGQVAAAPPLAGVHLNRGYMHLAAVRYKANGVTQPGLDGGHLVIARELTRGYFKRRWYGDLEHQVTASM